MWMCQETLLQNFVKFVMNLTYFAPWLPRQRPHILSFLSPKNLPHTNKVSWSMMKGIKKMSKFSLFCFHGNCCKVCLTNPNFCFGLSRSTRCGCCSYQVSSIFVQRVTCYDHFCLFQILPFWPFPWERQPFWKNQPLTRQLHMAYDIPTRFHKVWSRHLREIKRKTCVE